MLDLVGTPPRKVLKIPCKALLMRTGVYFYMIFWLGFLNLGIWNESSGYFKHKEIYQSNLQGPLLAVGCFWMLPNSKDQLGSQAELIGPSYPAWYHIAGNNSHSLLFL